MLHTFNYLHVTTYLQDNFYEWFDFTFLVLADCFCFIFSALPCCGSLQTLTFLVLADCFCFDLSVLSCCELLLTLPGRSLESARRLGGGYKETHRKFVHIKQEVHIYIYQQEVYIYQTGSLYIYQTGSPYISNRKSVYIKKEVCIYIYIYQIGSHIDCSRKLVKINYNLNSFFNRLNSLIYEYKKELRKIPYNTIS